jgi:nitrogen regulatory protein P-II 2
VKLITAIIPPERLEATKVELGKVNIFRLTVLDCQGLATEPIHHSSAGENGENASQGYGQSAPTNKAQVFCKIMIALNEEFVEPAVHAILRGAELKGVSNEFGRIFVSPLEEVIRIRTGERGPDAI